MRGEEMLSVVPLRSGPDIFAELTEHPSDKIKVLLQPV